MKLFSKRNWKERGLEIINSHFGKKRVYETYLHNNPILAEKYLRFVSRHVDAIYISYDSDRNNFRY